MSRELDTIKPRLRVLEGGKKRMFLASGLEVREVHLDIDRLFGITPAMVDATGTGHPSSTLVPVPDTLPPGDKIS